jgi:hypothetical protein
MLCRYPEKGLASISYSMALNAPIEATIYGTRGTVKVNCKPRNILYPSHRILLEITTSTPRYMHIYSHLLTLPSRVFERKLGMRVRPLMPHHDSLFAYLVSVQTQGGTGMALQYFFHQSLTLSKSYASKIFSY